jgi:hypothetical protein
MDISFIKLRASKFRTPSQGVVLAASKSSTLNYSTRKIAGYIELSGMYLEYRKFEQNTHLDIFAFHYTRIWLGFHEPIFSVCTCHRLETARNMDDLQKYVGLHTDWDAPGCTLKPLDKFKLSRKMPNEDKVSAKGLLLQPRS